MDSDQGDNKDKRPVFAPMRRFTAVPADRSRSPRVPTNAPTLKPGQRVTFDVHPGVDGPSYATNVRVIDDEDP
ncbi:cold shock domain-containing protein [Bacillus sp. NP157]|nr:cold shock domain-containing protein [Bacillus sp. NP157]